MGDPGRAGRVQPVPGTAKKKYQPWADFIASYGVDACLRLARLPGSRYEQFLGLWLNAERVDTRRRLQWLLALRDHVSPEVPLEYFRAACDTPEEAVARHRLHQAQVAFAQSRGTDGGLGQ